MGEKELTAKWQDYLFLTQEMKKFLQQHDTDMFFKLLDQREDIQEQIKQVDVPGFYTTPAAIQLLQVIQQANTAMLQTFHAVFNSMKKQETVSQAYEGMQQFTGHYLNRST